MKEKISNQSRNAMGSKVAPKTVDEYLVDIPEPARSTLKHIRAVIQSVVPADTAEVISYGIPMFKYKGMLVGYAAFKNHCSLYPMTGAIRRKLARALKGYEMSKGTVRLPLAKPIPVGLVKKLVRARMAELGR